MKPFQSVDKKTNKLRYSGQWLIKFRAPDGTWRRQVGGGTLKEAEEALADIEYRIRHGQWVDPRDAKKEATARAGDCRTFGDIVDKFRTYYADRSATARRNADRIADYCFKGPMPADTPISALTRAKAYAVRESIQAAPLAVATKNLLLTYFKMIFKWTFDNPTIPLNENPAKDLEAFSKAGTRKNTGMTPVLLEHEVFTDMDVEKMIDRAFSQPDKVNAYMFLTAVSSGMRKGELCGVRWCDVKLDAQLISVHRNYSREGTKSGEPRTVPISAELLSALREWKAMTPYSRDTDPVFPTADGHFRGEGFPWHRYVKKLAVRAGVDRSEFRKYGHMTRHFFATQWLRQGGSDVFLAEILGHKGTALIYSTYKHFYGGDLLRAMNKIGFSVTKSVTTQPLSEVIAFPVTRGK